MCFAGILANIESGSAESISGREFIARMERSIEAPSRRCSPEAPIANLGPRARLLELSSHIGGTAWFSARKSLCSASRQSSRGLSLLNVASNASKCTHLHLGRRLQLCTSLRGTVLSRPSLRVCCVCDGVPQEKQVQASSESFRGLLLVTVGQSKPLLSAGRVPQPSPRSKPRVDHQFKEPAAAKAGTRSRDVLLEELTRIAAEVTGTNISTDAPLMDSGLDSIGTTELSNKISAHLNTELSPTLLFDHPSLRSIADALSLTSGSSPTQGPEPE